MLSLAKYPSISITQIRSNSCLASDEHFQLMALFTTNSIPDFDASIIFMISTCQLDIATSCVKSSTVKCLTQWKPTILVFRSRKFQAQTGGVVRMVKNRLERMKLSTAQIVRTSQMTARRPKYCRTKPSNRSSWPQSSYWNLAPHYLMMIPLIEDLLAPRWINVIPTQWAKISYQSRVHWLPPAPSHYYIDFVTNL